MLPEDVFGFGRSGVLAIAKSCPSLSTLDWQEGYLFNQEEISQIIHCNCQLSNLIIPYAFVDDSTFTFIIEKLGNVIVYNYVIFTIFVYLFTVSPISTVVLNTLDT